MDGVVFFGRIGASELENDFAATRVFWNKSRYIVDVAVEDYPAALRCVMLCNYRALAIEPRLGILNIPSA